MIATLERYEPTQPLSVLVAELNRLYHECEARVYARGHPEIFEQLPPLWREMAVHASINGLPIGEKLRMLDFGCGTGFEARQCLEAFGAERIERLVCYDPSPNMLGQCRQALEGVYKAEYLSSLEQLGPRKGQFNLLITNSVLHHLADPVVVLREIAPLLSPHAVWISGHEPSRRFLSNPECREVFCKYRAADLWRRLISPRRYVRRALRLVRIAELPEDYAARCAHEQGMFRRRPPARLVSELVDYHVLVREPKMAERRGLDFVQLETHLQGEWELLWRRTYSFLGPHYVAGLVARWQGEAQRLAEKYADDGANCCLIWRRVTANGGT